MFFKIQQQHQKDLTVYRQAHQEWRNRYLHYLFIPIEYASFQVMCMSGCMGMMNILFPSFATTTTTTTTIASNNVIFLAITTLIRGYSWSVAFLCLLVVPSPFTRPVYMASAIFHVLLGEWIVGKMILMMHVQQQQEDHDSTYCWWFTYGLYAVVCWTVAWVIQVGIGHYYLERNEPNIANMSDVSFLSMVLSVLISWSS
jgi:uncharacterized membrane protein YGL010W